MFIPSMLLKRLYTFSSLKNRPNGVNFLLKNRLSDARLTGILGISLNGESIDLTQINLELPDGQQFSPKQVSEATRSIFLCAKLFKVIIQTDHLPLGKYKIGIRFKTDPFGDLKFDVEDSISEKKDTLVRIPRSQVDNYADVIIQERQQFVEKTAGKSSNT